MFCKWEKKKTTGRQEIFLGKMREKRGTEIDEYMLTVIYVTCCNRVLLSQHPSKKHMLGKKVIFIIIAWMISNVPFTVVLNKSIYSLWGSNFFSLIPELSLVSANKKNQSPTSALFFSNSEAVYLTVWITAALKTELAKNWMYLTAETLNFTVTWTLRSVFNVD